MTRSAQELNAATKPNWRKVAALSAKAAQQAAKRLDAGSFSRHMATLRLAEKELGHD